MQTLTMMLVLMVTACGGTIDPTPDAEATPDAQDDTQSVDATQDAPSDVPIEAEACRVIYGTWCRNDSGGPSDAAGCWFWYPADAGCGDQ